MFSFTCTEILQLPFLTFNTRTSVVDLQSPFQNGPIEGPIPINHPAGLPFGSSVQTNFSVSQREECSYSSISILRV